jgi:twitching motility protein PilT
MAIQDPKKEIQTLFDTLVSQGGSDLHLSSGRQPFIRINGELIPLADHQLYERADTLKILSLLVSEKNIEQLHNNEEIDFSYDYRKDLRLRGNAYVQQGAISIALRAIEKVKTFEALKLPQVLRHFTAQQQGFFLVVGPVGVGKSTTLAAMIDTINEQRKEHIITIESPIEHIFDEKNSIIDQREVGRDTLSFHKGIEAVFRQDVNVIMIGEMRTPETIATAVTAAETGHLVFSTLHTNNAAQTIDRIIDSFPAVQQDQIRAQLAGSLLGIFSQRLIPGLEGGRVLAYELLINTPAVANIIRDGRTHELDTIIETSSSEGMISLNRSLLELVRNGSISQESALDYSLQPEEFKKLI